MLCVSKLHLTNPAAHPGFKYNFTGNRHYSALGRPYGLRLPLQRLSASSSVRPVNGSTAPSTSEPSLESHYSSAVGCSSPLQLSHWNLTQRHVRILNFIACAVAVSATWLFFSAIPTLLAFKRAAESLEKLMDVTREELPDTMAAVRLSGMEISDLTMELSDLGQEITQGVRSSTRAVRLAEDRLRRLTNMTPPASVQVVASPKNDNERGPIVARTARGIREGIVKGRMIVQILFTISKYSKTTLDFLSSRGKK